MGLDSRSTLLSDIVRRFSQVQAAFFVLALGLVISFVAWRFTDERVGGEAAREFQQKTARAVETIDQRIEEYSNLLIGLKGLFAASDEVTRDEFQRYLSGFQLERRYFMLRVLSYGQRVTRTEKEAFEQRVRRDISVNPRGYPDFAIKPPGDRDEYVVVQYLEPMAGNEAGLGLDLYAEPVRRAGIERARDSGEPVATGPLVTTVNPNAISFALRVAVYRRGMPVQTVAQRREAFQGVAAAVIQAGELMGNLLGTQLGNDFELVVHDVGPWLAVQPEAPSRKNLLFDSRSLWGVEPEAGGFRQVAIMEAAGRKWQLSFLTPVHAPGVERALPMVVLLGGIVTSLLLFWLVWTLSVARERALKLAEQATAVRAAESLREEMRFIQQLIEAIPQPVYFEDNEGRNLGVNKAWEKFLGIPREQFVGKTVFELYPHDPELAKKHHAKDEELFSRTGSQTYEAAIVAADGNVHHVIYNKATFNKPDGGVAGLIGTITDVTGLKEAEAALREGEARFRDLTELSSDWYWEQNENFRFVEITGRDTSNAGTGVPHRYIGKTRWETGLEIVGTTWEEHRAALEAHQPLHDVLFRRRHPDGGMHYTMVSGRPIFDEQGRFKGYRGTGRDITEQKRSEDQIRHMAHHDALTELPNRVLLHDRIGQAIAQVQRSRKVAALLFLDLDRFKMVNDSLGHQVGDRLLRMVAERLVTCTRGTDTVARIGGDEFVVVLTDLDHAEDARHVAQKVLAELSQPFMIGNHELLITPSIGICIHPHDGEDVETLMRNADAAMYHAKEMGRNNCQFFTQQMNIVANQRLTLENELRHALEREELTLHYQPLIDLGTGDICGFEALVRWRHPQRGMVSPMQFIPVAEETGLIHPIGEWVLRHACSQALAWQHGDHPRVRVAVNISAQQFRREGMVETVARILREAGLPASCLELEITESIIIEHAEQVTARFTALHEMGVQLSIDDFGTGYSSLSYLQRFPIDKLKIDQSFVRDLSSDPNDAAIVTAIIAMAHSLGLKVVAEGVEMAEQLAFLKSLGCDGAQGYYFSKPLPAEEVMQLLRSWNLHAQRASA